MDHKTVSEQEQTIASHRQALLISGNLSDFQLKNLKTWPFLLFYNLETVSIEYDFSNDSATDNTMNSLCAGKVTFDFKFNKRTYRTSKETVEALNNLTNWTKFIFWNDSEVSFKTNGKMWITRLKG